MNNSQINTNFLPPETEESSRFVPSYIKNQCQCELCAQEYDLENKVPMMICDNQHNCCLYCVNQIIMRKKQCPFCRMNIDANKIFKNRIICKILEEMIKKQGKVVKINQNPQKAIKKNNAIIIPENNNNAAAAPPFLVLFIPQVPPILNQSQLDINAILLPHQRPVQESCISKVCKRIECSNGLFFTAYILAYIFSTPFCVVQLNYAFSVGKQNCMDQDYGVGMNLRQWMLSSGLIGLSMFTLQFLAMFIKIICNSNCFINVISVTNIVVFVLKFLGYNIVGLVLLNKVDPNDLAVCDGSVQSYMQAIFIILIIIFAGLCGMCDRR